MIAVLTILKITYHLTIHLIYGPTFILIFWAISCIYPNLFVLLFSFPFLVPIRTLAFRTSYWFHRFLVGNPNMAATQTFFAHHLYHFHFFTSLPTSFGEKQNLHSVSHSVFIRLQSGFLHIHCPLRLPMLNHHVKYLPNHLIIIFLFIPIFPIPAPESSKKESMPHTKEQ